MAEIVYITLYIVPAQCIPTAVAAAVTVAVALNLGKQNSTGVSTEGGVDYKKGGCSVAMGGNLSHVATL